METAMHDMTGQTSHPPRLRYWSAGQNGPRVLFVMGFGMRGDIWKPQIEGLKGDHQVAWFDNRGIGESESGAKSLWSMKAFARDGVGVVDALGWTRCHLVGVSLGGMIAQEMALNYQHRFKSLTLIATHDGGPLRRKIPPRHGVRNFIKANVNQGPERVDALRRLLYTDEFVASADQSAMDERIEMQIGRRAARSTTFRQLLAIVGHDTRTRLSKIVLPTLVMKPGQDILVQATGSDRLARAIPNAQLITFPHSGHGLIFQEAEAVNDQIRRHIARHT